MNEPSTSVRRPTAKDKYFLFERMSLDQIRTFAKDRDWVIDDSRLKVPGIAKALSRKRSISLQEIIDALNSVQLTEICRWLGLEEGEEHGGVAARVLAALQTASPRQLRKEAAKQEVPLVTVEAQLEEVIDGDTIRVKMLGRTQLIRFRGVDTPEMHESEKAEASLDSKALPLAEARPLGERARARLVELLRGQRIFLALQPVAPKSSEFRQHCGRLVAYVRLGSSEGTDVGEVLIREGFALVWPRDVMTRRYLHPHNEHYVEVCNQALQAKPGLWHQGLAKLCPCIQRNFSTWSVAACKNHCYREDWKELGSEPPSTAGGSPKAR